MLNTYVDHRLERWAEWVARRNDDALGFPHQSIYTRLMQRDSSAVTTPEINEEAWEVEQCVMAVKAVNTQLHLVIIEEYLRTKTKEQRYKACSCCEKTYYNRLARAQQLVLGYLNDLAADYPLPTIVVAERKYFIAA